MNQLTYKELKQISIELVPANVIQDLGFEQALKIARDMLVNEEWDVSLQEFATKLLEELQNKYPEKWSKSWKYDALLGYAYDIILKYDERFEAYNRALAKVSPPPPQLLVALASCCWAPGKPPITEDEAISLVKQAIKTTPYIEAVQLLRGLCKSIGNIEEQKHWEKVLTNIKYSAAHLPTLDLI
jgi:hypothetical protein